MFKAKCSNKAGICEAENNIRDGRQGDESGGVYVAKFQVMRLIYLGHASGLAEDAKDVPGAQRIAIIELVEDFLGQAQWGG